MCLLTQADFFLKVLFIYLRERERKNEHSGGGGTEGEREVDSPLSTQPDAELDPRTLRS